MAEAVATRSFKTTDGPVSTVEFVESGELKPHRHMDAQLTLVTKGLISCEISNELWMVPPQCAVWIPAEMDHTVRGMGNLQVYCVYIRPELTDHLPRECCTLKVSPLLRELVIETSHLPSHYDAGTSDGRLIATMLDRLALAKIEQLRLPLPADPRLRRIADRLIADPSDRTRLPELARMVGMCERTFSRLLVRETGMNFGRWRQQFQITLALERLSRGDTVQAIALDLGFESSSAFITMFRKTLGKPPLKYVADRSQGAAQMGSSGATNRLTGGGADYQSSLSQ